ncbi:hypothetical protein BH09BAC2_BH09BAC2_05410 [soil metagenome]
MNIIRLAGELFLIYIIYKLIFGFVIPIYQTTKRVKKQFGEMNEKMNQQMNTEVPTTPPTAAKPSSKNEEYIDYEEIKP